MSKSDSISMSVIRRLPRYYRFLSELDEQNVKRISSTGLADIMNVTASQVRQDLNCFGGFGQQGYGYSVSQLRFQPEKASASSREVNLCRLFWAFMPIIAASTP